MDAIVRAAQISVGRACLFGTLAIVCVMVGFSYQPPLSARVGGGASFGMTLVLLLKALLAERRPYRRTETWLLLADRERPPAAVAQQVVGGVLKAMFLQYASYSALATIVLLSAAFILTLSLGQLPPS